MKPQVSHTIPAKGIFDRCKNADITPASSGAQGLCKLRRREFSNGEGAVSGPLPYPVRIRGISVPPSTRKTQGPAREETTGIIENTGGRYNNSGGRFEKQRRKFLAVSRHDGGTFQTLPSANRHSPRAILIRHEGRREATLRPALSHLLFKVREVVFVLLSTRIFPSHRAFVSSWQMKI